MQSKPEYQPTIIETPTGPVEVAGTDIYASQAEYTDREKAVEAITKALTGIESVAKRYGLFCLTVVGAECDKTAIAGASIHGDGAFVGVAMVQLARTPGFAEAMDFEIARRDAAAVNGEGEA